MTITREELDSLKALAEAATEGPWRKLAHDHRDKPERWVISGGMVSPLGKLIAVNPQHQGNDLSPRKHQANAAFIAASREAVTRLIVDLVRARVLLQAFVKAYEKATPSGGYDVAEANAYSEAGAYLIDAGIE